jgi:uncharacterized protein YqcC (DUF446 family)
VNSRFQGKAPVVVTFQVEYSLSMKNTDDMTSSRFWNEAADLEKSDSIDIKPFGMDIVTEHLGFCKWLTWFAKPAVLDKLFHKQNLPTNFSGVINEWKILQNQDNCKKTAVLLLGFET